MKKRNVFWGMFFLLGAVFIIASQRTDFVDIGFWSIIGTLLCLAFLLHTLINLEFAGVVFPVAILYIIYQKPLELFYINPWILLAAALVATIGLTMLLPRGLRWRKYSKSGGGQHKYTASVQVGEDSDEHVTVNSRMGAVNRYVHSQNLKSLSITCQLGGIEVYCEQAKLAPEGAVGEIDCQLGGVELYIPRGWRVEDRINTTLGGVTFGHRSQQPGDDAPLLTLTGSVQLGGVEIHFV